MHRPSTRLWYRAYSGPSAGLARLAARAILSDAKYDVHAIAIAMTIAIGTIATPALKMTPRATATAAISSTKAASITKVRRLLRAICSYMPMRRGRAPS